MLNDCACQTSSFDIEQSNDQIENLSIKFPLITIEDINISMNKINHGLGWYKIHTQHLQYCGSTLDIFCTYLITN